MTDNQKMRDGLDDARFLYADKHSPHIDEHLAKFFFQAGAAWQAAQPVQQGVWHSFHDGHPQCLELVLVWREQSRRFDLAHGTEAHLIPGCSHWMRIYSPDRTPQQPQPVSDYVKMRLAQIASGDYKACGHTAEEVARDALAAIQKGTGHDE